MRCSINIFYTEVISGVWCITDETCWHPLQRGSTGPNRPCKPYIEPISKKEQVTPRPLDRPMPLHYRLRTGFYMLNPYENNR